MIAPLPCCWLLLLGTIDKFELEEALKILAINGRMRQPTMAQVRTSTPQTHVYPLYSRAHFFVRL